MAHQVLVVEDNPADVYVIGEAFRECGYKCELTFVASHQEAQQSLISGSFDLILSDFGTDRTSAEAFVRSVRANSPRLPIVILSGSFNPNIAYDAGANAFVKKSGDISTFFEKIRGIMRFWIDVAELPTQQPKAVVNRSRVG